MTEYTGNFWYSFDDATELANKFSKSEKEYFTEIKGMDDKSNVSREEIWAVTNKFNQ